jgi:hypothetical protein
MNHEEALRLKIRKIEALFEGAGTAGERDAAEATLGCIKEKLAQAVKTGPSLEYRFTFGEGKHESANIPLKFIFRDTTYIM